MIWFMLMQVFSTLLQIVLLRRQSEREKDLEILLLRRQLAILERYHAKRLQISRVDKLSLTVLTTQLQSISRWTVKQLSNLLRIVQPETVFKWHRELVRQKWTFQQPSRGGRPRTAYELEQLVVRLARENPAWGNARVAGELTKLGYSLSDETIATILKRHGIPPAPERHRSPSWQNLMAHYRDQILACDFFTVETLFLQTIYVLFFIELSTRRVYIAGCTTEPRSAWIVQQARQLTWQLEGRTPAVHFLIHDRDTKFTEAFNTVFRGQAVHVILTPFRAPNANAVAERWVRTVRQECLDKLLILTQAHLRRVLADYQTYYNEARPHQGLAQRAPLARVEPTGHGPVRCRAVLGGILRDYYRAAA